MKVFLRKDETLKPYYLYATIECANKFIILSGNKTDSSADAAVSTLSRDNLGIIIVSIDSVIMVLFLLFIWAVQYMVKLDTERHRNALLETHQFALIFTNLPVLSEGYPLEKLKADLWEHIVLVINEEDQQIKKLEHSAETSCEIVDI